ncbi:MAG: SAM-dependent DNA methyltransferase [Sandaracinus sp.]|nr:SAM-dependent DNA methyltransferase [Sandaracinus sp.]
MAVKRKTDEGASSAPKRRGRPPKDRSAEAAASAPAKGKRGKGAKAAKSGANLGFEEKLWQAADKLRGSMDASEYKHVVLGLIFLKYVSDAFEQRRAEVLADEFGDAEDRDEYEGKNVFWVPPEGRWEHLRERAKSPEIGVLIDAAMDAIERENKTLRGTLPKDYARPAVDKTRLGELLDLLSDVALVDENKDHRSTDLLGRVYEYFLGRFASAEGRGGGEFYTPQSVVRVLVEMLEPYSGRVYDPCCGSGGMFVQSEKFVEEHGGKKSDLSIYGQEWNATTWKLAKMNLAIRGIEANLGDQWGDTMREDKHKGLKADYVLANPPFNISDWGGEHLRDDPRWKFGVPPAGNANFAWLQHIVSKLSPRGVAGVVLANGSMASQQSGEGEIRKALVEADLVDCMVALPGQLFYSTQIPVCLWFLARDKRGGVGVGGKKLRDRSGQTLFIHAGKLGTLVDRTHRELGDEEIARIAETYHRWRGEGQGKYEDVPGFCVSAKSGAIEQHQFVLTPGRYVGAEDLSEEDEPFDERVKRLVATLDQQFREGTRLDASIRENLRGFRSE